MKNKKCIICGSLKKKIFEKTILNKYKGEYFECEKCGFIQVQDPKKWLDKAYSDVIAKTDIGILARNLVLSKKIIKILQKYFTTKSKFLDYAGGYGIFTRLMRDVGFDFYHEDSYSKNIFAETFEAKSLKTKKFDLITSFEFMEHIENPIDEVKKLLKRTDSFLFSTEIVPKNNLKNWWYLTTETGQHISFYTQKSFEELAKKLKLNYITNGRNLHLLTKRNDLNNIFKKSFFEFIFKQKKLKSLLMKDYEKIKKELKKGK